MTFIIDAQLPPALAQLITAAGHEGIHVEEIDLRDADDSAIWHHALALNAAIITKDEDFASRVASGRDCPVIVWLRVGNCSNRALHAWFEPLFPDIMRQIEQGQILIEVR